MAKKSYGTDQALDPSQEKPGGSEVNYSEFVEALPEEFKAEIEEALAAMLSYVHSDEGTSEIIDALQSAKGDISAQIGKSALMAMDEADPDHKWSESAKVFGGYFAVHEVALIAKEAGIAEIDEDQEGEIFKQAAQNYLHYMIKSKPTREERDAEAIRLQKEVEPLMTGKMREKGMAVAKKEGLPMSHGEVAAQPKKGLLE